MTIAVVNVELLVLRIGKIDFFLYEVVGRDVFENCYIYSTCPILKNIYLIFLSNNEEIDIN